MASLVGPRLTAFCEAWTREETNPKYLHWDKLKHLSPPVGLSSEEWWAAIKVARKVQAKAVPLMDRMGRTFQFGVPESVAEALHRVDLGAGGMVSIPEPITNPATRDRYLVHSLMEEAITSSQLEGAATTRVVAKELIRSGRAPRDVGERMILNNFKTMEHVRSVQAQQLSPELVFHLHNLVTEGTLEDGAGGRFRNDQEYRVVGDDFGEVFHEPPPAQELSARMEAMCNFANAKTPAYFIHPAIRAVILHFWLAYDHPFVDGNGRTARALFYWAMLHRGYWLFEFISISQIIRKAPVKYGKSFLHSETDGNDLTYFIVAQFEIIRRAINELHLYIERKTTELRDAELHLKGLDSLNYRQVELVRHALKHPGQRYTIRGHQMSHQVAYQTARTDLLGLATRGILEKRTRGKQQEFLAPSDIGDRLKNIGAEG